MDWHAALGFIAGVLTTFSFVPQVIRILRLQSARDISLSFTLLLLVGVVLWLAYGILQRLWPVIIWNAIASLLISFLVYAKLRYGRHDSAG